MVIVEYKVNTFYRYDFKLTIRIAVSKYRKGPNKKRMLKYVYIK